MAHQNHERSGGADGQHEEKTQLLREADTAISAIFQGESRLAITESAQGYRRVRAFVPDEDGYMGYIEQSSYVGLAEVAGSALRKYLAEQHFPYAHESGRPTYLWEYSPDAADGPELLMRRVETAGGDQILDLPIVADAQHTKFFRTLAKDLRNAMEFHDLEADFRDHDYTFQLPPLA